MHNLDADFPAAWPECFRPAMLHVVSLAQWAIIHARSWCTDTKIARVRLASELDQARNEVMVLKEEIRIKDARMARCQPNVALSTPMLSPP